MATFNRHRRLAGPLFVALSAACSGDATGPGVGTIRVSAPTSGGDLDLDGYEIVLSGSNERWTILANKSYHVRNVTPGNYTVSLDNVAPNCRVDSTHPRLVNVRAGQTVDVSFVVECEATGIAVTTRTTGIDLPFMYEVIVTGRTPVAVDANSSVVVSRLEAGTYTVALVPSVAQCSVAGGNETTAEVVARSVTQVRFEVTCVPEEVAEKIAFAADVQVGGMGGRWITLVKPDGSGMTRLVLGDSPSWSPDGNRLVYSTTHCDSFYWYYYGCPGGLDVIDPDLGGLTKLANGDGGFTPAWAPTGNVIAFSLWRGSGLSPERFYTLGLDGSPLTERSPGVKALTDPAWSPDGQRIAYACSFEPVTSVAGPSWDLCIADRDGTGQTRLTSDPAPEFGPAWSPDGERIAFSRGSDIVIVTLGDTSVTWLTQGSDPDWSPDGSKLVFAGRDGLFTINADGSNQARLTTGAHYAPAWRPSTIARRDCQPGARCGLGADEAVRDVVARTGRVRE